MRIICPACGESREYPTAAEDFEGEVKCKAYCTPLKIIVKNGRLISAEEADPMHTENLNGEKLRILLNHWVQHNKEHSQEFREWAKKVKGFGKAEIRDDILEAAQGMDKANEPLLRALAQIYQKPINKRRIFDSLSFEGVGTRDNLNLIHSRRAFTISR